MQNDTQQPQTKALTPEEFERIVAFVSVLAQIDKRIKQAQHERVNIIEKPSH